MNSVDRIAIYQKLVAIKPFFEDVEKIKKRKINAKNAYQTAHEKILVEKIGGVFVEQSPVVNRPMFLLY